MLTAARSRVAALALGLCAATAAGQVARVASVSHAYGCGNDRVFFEKDSVKVYTTFQYSRLPVGKISFDLDYVITDMVAGERLLGVQRPLETQIKRRNIYEIALASSSAWSPSHVEYEITAKDTLSSEPWILLVGDDVVPDPSNPRSVKHRVWKATCRVTIPWPEGQATPFPQPPPAPPAEMARDSLRDFCRTSFEGGSMYRESLEWQHRVQVWGPGTIDVAADFTPFDSSQHLAAGVYVPPPATFTIYPAGDFNSPKRRSLNGVSPLRGTLRIADPGVALWDVNFFATRAIREADKLTVYGNERVRGTCAFSWPIAFPLNLLSIEWLDDPDPGLVTLRFDYEWTKGVDRAPFGVVRNVWLNLYSGTGGDVARFIGGVSRGEHGQWRDDGGRTIWTSTATYEWSGQRPVDLAGAIAVSTDWSFDGQAQTGAKRRVVVPREYASTKRMRVRVGATQFGTIAHKGTELPSAANNATAGGRLGAATKTPPPISKPASGGTKAPPSAAPRTSVPTLGAPTAAPKAKPAPTPAPVPASDPLPQPSATGSFRVSVPDAGINTAGTTAWFCRQPLFVLTLEKEGFTGIIGGIAAPGRGSHPVIDDTASGKFSVVVASMEPLRAYTASSGTLTITQSSETRIAGRFSVVAKLEEDDRVKEVAFSGSFDAAPSDRC